MKTNGSLKKNGTTNGYHNGTSTGYHPNGTSNGYHHPKEQFEPMLDSDDIKSIKEGKPRIFPCTRRCRWILCITMTVIVGATAAFFLTMMFKSPTPGDAEADFQLPDISAMEIEDDDSDYDDYYEDQDEVIPTVISNGTNTKDSNISQYDVGGGVNDTSVNSNNNNTVAVGTEPNNVILFPTSPTPVPRTRPPAKFLMPDLENIVLSGIYPVSVDELHETVAGDDSTYVQQWYEDHDAVDFSITDWGPGEGKYEGHEYRKIEYDQKMKSMFVPKGKFRVDVEEVRYKGWRRGSKYTVDLFNYASGVMYGESFYTIARYNLRRITRNSAELTVSYVVKDVSIPWLMRGTIKGNAASEISKVYEDMGTDLDNMFPQE